MIHGPQTKKMSDNNTNSSSNKIPTSSQISSKDIHTSGKLKFLKPGQNTKTDLTSRNLIQELLEREQPTISSIDSKQDQDRDSEVENISPSSSSGESDSEELLKELDRIKHQKEQERIKRQELEEQERTKQMINANPLVQIKDSNSLSGRIKRHWKDDCVFKNQAIPENKTEQNEFVNDTIRSKNHRSFMQKYFK